MSKSDIMLRILAVPQCFIVASQRGMSAGERLDQLKELVETIRSGHIPKSVFVHIEAELEDSDPVGYSKRIHTVTDGSLAKMCQLMMGGLSHSGGYSLSFAEQCREHFTSCPHCRSQACGFVRSNEIMNNKIRRLLASLPEASEQILARVMREIDDNELKV